MTQLRVPPITLDALQQMAVQAGDGPVLVEGGHGSGKTHAVLARTGILLDRGVPPDDIACITGTLHGTVDLRRRLAEFSKTQEVYDSMFIGTMVDLALLLLRSHGIQVGQSPIHSRCAIAGRLRPRSTMWPGKPTGPRGRRSRNKSSSPASWNGHGAGTR